MGDDGFLLEVALVAVLILLNGFFAGAEIAVISAPRARVQVRAGAGERSAQTLLRLKGDPDRFLATVQIGVTLVGTLASAVGGVAAIERLEPFFASSTSPWLKTLAEPLAVATVVFTIAYLSLVVGELVPKSLAVRHSEIIALGVARPIDWLSRMSAPVVSVLTASSKVFLALLRQKAEAVSPFHTLDDLKAIIKEAEAQGVVTTDVVTGAIEFQDSEVRNVVTPRSRINGIPLNATLRQALEIVVESGHSRFPLYEGDLDRVVGIVFARDLLEASLVGEEIDLSTLAHPALVVPTSKSAAALLGEMRSYRCQMAIAVDEHGSTVGLVTLEDLLEVIVGDIQDEHDAPAPAARQLPDRSVEADGSLSLRRLNAEFGLRLPESSAYVTVAGLVLDHLGSVPTGGERVAVPPYSLEVLQMDGRRIARVRIEAAPATPSPQTYEQIPGK
jgi:putative hemolysin